MDKCALCQSVEVSENAPVLVMGAYGNPKYVCNECNADLDCATLGRDFEEIGAAMERLGKKMASAAPDKLTLATVGDILRESAERAKKIKAGEYDFSLDQAEEPVEDTEADDLPLELLESEEDKALDKRDEERLKRFDKVTNVIIAVMIIAAVGYVAYKLLSAFW